MTETSGSALPPSLLLGTSSWSSKDWEGVFYPEGMASGDYLSHYATRFRTVEVDATFYRTPSAAMTERWARILPEGFQMAAKVPQVVTHEKRLEGCRDEFEEFVKRMAVLEDRLGPLLLQFPYFKKASGMTAERFIELLRAFVPHMPSGFRYVVEVRNKTWLRAPLMDFLREHGLALALIDHPWMPRAGDYLAGPDPLTADFCYLRWLGDRYKIEEQTKSWNKVVVDRTRETRAWIPVVRKLLASTRTVYGYFNNHYAGHAPASIELFERTWVELAGD